MSEWIKCEDRLPELDTTVWIRMPGDQMIVAERSSSTDGWEWGNCYGSQYFSDGVWACAQCELDDAYDPTHWMPLPQPPTA